MANVRQPGVWGIDLGQCAMKALRLEVINGEVVATAFDYIEHPKILSQPDADPDQLTREALQQFLSRNQIRGDQIAISVPGQTGLARFVKLPPVEPSKIPDIVKFEAKQQIPFPLDEVVWDWQTIGTGGQTEGYVENEIGLFAMKRDMIGRYLQAFQEVDVEVHHVQMAPLALCNFVAFDLLGKQSGANGQPQAGDDEEKNCIVALDIGADATSLIVTDGGRIIWQRPLPIGGNHFTRALTKDLKLTFAKAEHLKRNATKAEDPRKIFQAMKPVFSDFVAELKRSLGFFTNTHRDVQVARVLGLGNAFRLPGLQKFISQNMEMEVEKLPGFQRLKGDDVVTSPAFADNLLSFGVAYGLALQGLKLSKLQTNLLPQEIQFERVIRAKKPWAAAAVACLLLGTGVLTFVLSGKLNASSLAATEADKAQKGVLAEKTRYISEFNTEMDANKAALKAAEWIIKGAEERVNWALINRYIVECVPQPDGTNVPVEAKKHWDAAALKAYQTKLKYDEKGLKDEDVNPADMIHINLQGVYARYIQANAAKEFYSKVKSGSSTWKESMDETGEWKDAPSKNGWVVEIRGYTFHRGNINFVNDTLVHNLRKRKEVWSSLNDPYGRRIKLEVSHVAVIRQHRDENWTPDKGPNFKWISAQGLVIDSLDDGGSNIMGGGTGRGIGGRPPWVGLGSGAGSAGQAGTGVAGQIGPGAAAPGGRGTGPVGYPGATAPGATTPDFTGSPDGGTTSSTGVADPRPPAGASAKSEPAKKMPRTEFVIVFYWVEPLPSEPGKPIEGAATDMGAPGGMQGYPGLPEGGMGNPFTGTPEGSGPMAQP